jgi:hypothetical protein
MTIYVPPGKGIEIISAPGAAPLESLAIRYVSQRPQANWCWAACCVMVASHLRANDPDLGGPPTMCHLAGFVHNQPNCCADPSVCDDGAWPEPAYAHLGIQLDPDVPSPPVNSGRVLTLDEIRDEIVNHRRPVEVLYKWSTHGAHVVLISGIYADGQLEVLDPWFNIESPVSYDYVRTARGLGRWEGTYRRFAMATPLPGAASVTSNDAPRPAA